MSKNFMHHIVINLIFQKERFKCDDDKNIDRDQNINLNIRTLKPGFRNPTNASKVLLYHSYLD